MVLVFDVGNTHIEIGLFVNSELKDSWRIATGADRTEDEYMVSVQHFLAQREIRFKQLKAVVLASVVPNVSVVLEKMCGKYLNLEPLVIDYTKNLGLKILYSNPASVGADRLCSAVAARRRFSSAVIVVDFGTATTFDVVNSQGEYLGGIIAPGLETTAWALYQRAAKLPKISLRFPARAIGRSTEESMQSGIMLGAVKMIDGMLADIKAELGEEVRIIATGGLSRLIQPRTQMIELYDENLVLKGAYEIYRMNRKQPD